MTPAAARRFGDDEVMVVRCAKWKKGICLLVGEGTDEKREREL